MFNINTRKLGLLSEYCLINEQSGEYVTVVPAIGANVREAVLKGHGMLIPVLNGYSSEEELRAQQGYRNSRLIPFPNRVASGRYHFEGTAYQLPINRPKENLAIHGLLYNRRFQVKKAVSGVREAVLELFHAYRGDVPGYPFHLDVSIFFTLRPGGFSSRLVVRNTGREPLPFGDGWHPYFSFSQGRNSVDALQLKLPDCELLELDEYYIPTGAATAYDHFTSLKTIGKITLDNCLRITGKGNVVTSLYDPTTQLTLGLWQRTGQNGYNFLQIYIPAERNSIALEPMTCAPDAFNNGLGLVILQPGETMEAAFGVYLE